MGDTEAERTELENALQQLFIECKTSASTSTMDSDSDAMPISQIVEYIHNQLSNLSIDNLIELSKCLVSTTTGKRVNLMQFKEATKRWIAKIQESVQDGNNNTQEKLFLVNDADSSMKTMNGDKDIVELEFREKFRELYKENISLHDELERHEALIHNFKQQYSTTEKQLKQYIQKCQQLEKESDEQRDQLNESIKKEKTMALTLQRYTKEHQNLLKKLEIAEIEIHSISSLKEKLEKITKEKMDYMKLIIKMEEKLNEKEDSCKQLKSTVDELEDSKISITESYKSMIENLREKNRLLMDENEELQSLSAVTTCPLLQEKLSISPISDADVCYRHSTPYKSMEVSIQDSLYTELKALGFTPACSRNETQELEEELHEYDSAIYAILEQLEKVIQFFIMIRGSTADLSHFNLQNTNAKTYDVLKRKADFLLCMVTEEITRRSMKRDVSTQLRVDPVNTIDSLDQFGIKSFQDLLSTHRYRSVHTLPPTLQSSQIFGYHKPEMNTNAIFAHGDGLIQKCDEESTLLVVEAPSIPEKENQTHSEKSRPCEISKESSILISKTLVEEEKNTRNVQVPEMSSANNPASPRRKISVYCRSFDVVAVQDQREDYSESNLRVKQSSSCADDSPIQIDKIPVKDQNSTPGAKYKFDQIYRSAKKNDSDSSNSTPRKFEDSLLDDEPTVERPMSRKIRLAPTRLRFSLENGNELNKTAGTASNCVSPVCSTELITSDSLLSLNGKHKKDDDSSVPSSSTFVDKCKIKVKNVTLGSKSYLTENTTEYSMLNHRLFLRDQANSAKIVDSESPHSQTSMRIADSESPSQIERSVDSQMSRREDSLIVSDNEREPTAGSGGRCGIDEKVVNEASKAVNESSTSLATDLVSTRVITPCKNVTQSNEKARERNPSKTNQEAQQWPVNMKRSYSEGASLGPREGLGCCCNRKNASSIPESNHCKIFPSLTDIRLKESGLAYLSETEDSRENLSELELQKKYTAFSLCLSVDRFTLPRRIAMSCRQRDQSEKNLSSEVQKMQQDIQELAPLCTDRESVERVERVRHQLDMIVRCAHRVSCAAETLGAVHQERRVSRAVLLADKYLQVLQSRCEKLIANVAETKRILVENNIVIEEHSSELNDELPRIRYRSGTPVNNRMMEVVRQRNSVSGRMTLRRPSFSSESPKWEMEKLDRTESSNSIGELRGIFEQAESRRNSREENNNSQTVNYAIVDNETWTNVKEETSELSDNESINSESRSSTRSSYSFQLTRRRRLWRIISSILIFCLVFYVIQAISTVNTCHEPLNERLVRCVFDTYRQSRNTAPHPM
ncbi:inositol 1,4,5-triphosphate receptor associated 2 isoform X2 [Cardiocondyla obscurior]|uniref:inositol 1,4,5-triphosphate receptor associated 2 isoform X2 n=1 Tax=Cardiocondyla obscurior TaxID=286306 RepID=UPI0039657E8C